MSTDPAGPTADHLDHVRDLASRTARQLARQEVRVSVAIELLERSEQDTRRLVHDIVVLTTRLAIAGGATVPVYRPIDVGAGDAQHPAVVEAEEIVRVRARELARRARARRRPTTRLECWVVGLLAFVGFASLGSIIAIRTGVVAGDSLSRVAAAQSVVTGRDPHLEAIGFVWGPFPTMFEIPLLWLRSLWPELSRSGVAAVLVSAAFMAGTLVQLLLWGRDGGAPRWFRWTAVVLIAAHPLVWLYGANGMSEACGLFFLVVATRHLTRWTETDDVGGLMVAGLALGMAYLARYEALAAVLGAVLVVWFVAWHRSGSTPEGALPRGRLRSAIVDVTVLAFPAGAAVALWALVSWVIVGEPFAQFSSEYGNSAIVRAGSSGIAAIIGDLSAPGRTWFFLQQLGVAAGASLALVLLALWIGGRTASRTTVALAVMGTPIVIQFVFALQGATFPWFRYVSGAVVLGALVVLAVGGSSPWMVGRHWVRPLALVLLVPGVIASTAVIRSGDLGAEDDGRLVAALEAAVSGETVPEAQAQAARGARVADDIDRRRGVEPGSVLSDTSSTFAVVAAAPRPEVYIVPPDRDFEAVVSDPATFGIRYVLLRGPATPGDAIVRQFPDIWPDGAPIARLMQTWGGADDRAGQYRLYAVDDPAPRTRPTPEDGFTP